MAFKMRIAGLVFVVAFAGANLSVGAGTPQRQVTGRDVRLLARPYLFSFLGWHVRTWLSLPGEMLGRKGKAGEEAKLRLQMRTVLADRDMPPLPPVLFRLEDPPHLLVVSPRDRIAYAFRETLRQDLSLEEMEKLEAVVGGLGISSLVVELGGFGGTYPAIVGDRLRLDDTIRTVLEEWVHQYLTFRPLGFSYLLDSLGISRRPESVDINETLANMVSEELGDEVLSRFYLGQPGTRPAQPAPGFDFDAEMRETRRKVDEYLSRGNVDEAERYMEERRLLFVARGYRIRKLNQAYFAFHGIYGRDPASVSPVYRNLLQLRARSTSLKTFLNRVAGMTTYADLREALR